MGNWIDCHAHILPGVDDGVKTATEFQSTLAEELRQGVSIVFATSHLKSSVNPGVTWEDEARVLESVRYLVPAGMTVPPGCEYYWDSDVYDAADWAPRPLGESRCVLIELPYHAELDNAKRGVELAIRHGQTPILAHPERYDIFQEQPGQTLAWVRESGVLLQLNAFDLTDTEHRQAVRDAAWRLVSARLATFLGTDTHGRKRMPVYAEGAELLRLWAEREADGAAYLEGLTHGNAERLLLGRTAE